MGQRLSHTDQRLSHMGPRLSLVFCFVFGVRENLHRGNQTKKNSGPRSTKVLKHATSELDTTHGTTKLPAENLEQAKPTRRKCNTYNTPTHPQGKHTHENTHRENRKHTHTHTRENKHNTHFTRRQRCTQCREQEQKLFRSVRVKSQAVSQRSQKRDTAVPPSDSHP